ASGHERRFPFQIFLARLEHFFGEINRTVTGRLRANDRAAPGKTFSSHHAGEFVFESLIHAEQEPDLARADADVARGHVGLGSNVAQELTNDRLTKARPFAFAFSVGIEIGTAFTAAHWQRSKRVFEDLFEREKFQDPKIDRRMKSEPAFVGA